MWLFLLWFCIASANAESLEEKIKNNETLIDTLQKTLEEMQNKGETPDRIRPLQDHIDEVISHQNKLLEAKAGSNEILPNQSELEVTIRRIVREEIAKQSMQPKLLVPGTNPYDAVEAPHAPTDAEIAATKKVEGEAPELPEVISPAVAQYEQALELYNKKAYKEAAASFGRIVKAYPKDPIIGKALVHLALSLEKQGDLESAAVVCESVVNKKIDDLHKADCNLIRLKYAKSKGNSQEIQAITKALQGAILTPEQKTQYAGLVKP